jgi:hypothetical protein
MLNLGRRILKADVQCFALYATTFLNLGTQKGTKKLRLPKNNDLCIRLISMAVIQLTNLP